MDINEHLLSYVRDGKTINYVMFANCDLAEVNNMIFLGTLQGRLFAKTVLKSIPAYSAVVQGAPHWHARKDGSDISDFIFDFTNNVMSRVSEVGAKNIHLIAESQAAPGAINFTLNNLSIVSKLTLVQPLGLNQSAFGKSDNQRIKILRSRILMNFMQNLYNSATDKMSILSNIEILRYLIKDVLNKSAAAQYGSGLRHDLSEDLRQVAYKVPVDIIVGERDQIFPAREIHEAIARNGIQVHKFESVKGLQHVPLSSRLGERLLSSIDFDYSS